MNLNSPLTDLKGIGDKTAQLFAKVGVSDVGELLAYYPRAYERYEEPAVLSSLREGETASVRGQLAAPIVNQYLRGRCISTAVCRCAPEDDRIAAGTGRMDGPGDELLLTWYNMPYLKNSLRTGEEYIFRGKVKKKGRRPLFEQAAVFSAAQYQALTISLQPVYSLTRGLTIKMVQKAVKQVLLSGDGEDADDLPEELRDRYHLCTWRQAVSQIHFPDNQDTLSQARRRLVFDEFFFFLIQLRHLKERRGWAEHPFQIQEKGAARLLISALSYELTNAQKSVWDEIRRDLTGEKVMARLIQGDVGSGKTILAVLALLTVAENGYQGAMMAPTDVLARQHFDSIQTLLSGNHLPYEVLLLTGSMTASQKKEAYAKMASGEASIIIGTHALIQEKAIYHNLALVITDEQHRFGVRQRENLSQKGSTPHTMVMSATPIPRTLAVILYGDLDISVLREKPAERLPIKNCVVGPSWRPKAYAFIESQVRLGHQAYVICPMVEESDMVDAENVMEYTETLRQAFHGAIRVGSLHGRMKPAEKNEIMERFLQNEIQVLVSTTVVEVGVNVPNATVMMIENAERFGLAQLHQLRGRVGRGAAQSYCIFLHAVDNDAIRERLDILNHSNDGFEIAAKDLKLRGPGDLFGVRQSGLMNFRLADIYADAEVLQQANEAVGRMMEEDPDLELPGHQKLRERYEALVSRRGESVNL
ncbi:MAG: ATP-dependent DNA helicase RecG [Lachnospiraceae bacterium]|nr:ATP-dependent DNA helicase RecG [Lachnospiraceae bacterium]